MSVSSEQSPSSKFLLEIGGILSQQNELLKRLGRPYIIVDLIPRHFVNIFYLRIRNVGHTPAYNISLSADPPFFIREKIATDFHLFQHPISALAPQDEITFFFGSAIELYNDQNAVLKFSITTKYIDPQGEQYSSDFAIDAELFRGLAVELPMSDKIAEHLDKIKREIEEISRYTDDLRTQDLMRRYEQSRSEEHFKSQDPLNE